MSKQVKTAKGMSRRAMLKAAAGLAGAAAGSGRSPAFPLCGLRKRRC